MSLEKVMGAVYRLCNENDASPMYMKMFWEHYNTLPSAKHLLGTNIKKYNNVMAKKYASCLKEVYQLHKQQVEVKK